MSADTTPPREHDDHRGEHPRPTDEPIPDDAATESMAGEEDPGAAMDTSLVGDAARRAARADQRTAAADRTTPSAHETHND